LILSPSVKAMEVLLALSVECSGLSNSFVIAGPRRKKTWKWVLTEEKYDEIGARFEYSPEKTPRHVAYETGVSCIMFA
jgi:hypothetical protein